MLKKYSRGSVLLELAIAIPSVVILMLGAYNVGATIHALNAVDETLKGINEKCLIPTDGSCFNTEALPAPNHTVNWFKRTYSSLPDQVVNTYKYDGIATAVNLNDRYYDPKVDVMTNVHYDTFRRKSLYNIMEILPGTAPTFDYYLYQVPGKDGFPSWGGEEPDPIPYEDSSNSVIYNPTKVFTGPGTVSTSNSTDWTDINQNVSVTIPSISEELAAGCESANQNSSTACEVTDYEFTSVRVCWDDTTNDDDDTTCVDVDGKNASIRDSLTEEAFVVLRVIADVGTTTPDTVGGVRFYIEQTPTNSNIIPERMIREISNIGYGTTERSFAVSGTDCNHDLISNVASAATTSTQTEACLPENIDYTNLTQALRVQRGKPFELVFKSRVNSGSGSMQVKIKEIQIWYPEYRTEVRATAGNENLKLMYKVCGLNRKQARDFAAVNNPEGKTFRVIRKKKFVPISREDILNDSITGNSDGDEDTENNFHENTDCSPAFEHHINKSCKIGAAYNNYKPSYPTEEEVLDRCNIKTKAHIRIRNVAPSHGLVPILPAPVLHEVRCNNITPPPVTNIGGNNLSQYDVVQVGAPVSSINYDYYSSLSFLQSSNQYSCLPIKNVFLNYDSLSSINSDEDLLKFGIASPFNPSGVIDLGCNYEEKIKDILAEYYSIPEESVTSIGKHLTGSTKVIESPDACIIPRYAEPDPEDVIVTQVATALPPGIIPSECLSLNTDLEACYSEINSIVPVNSVDGSQVAPIANLENLAMNELNAALPGITQCSDSNTGLHCVDLDFNLDASGTVSTVSAVYKRKMVGLDLLGIQPPEIELSRVHSAKVERSYIK